mmetsp:Transcript_23504/g.61823  ORF Transcript_23504/g.61823 Transcript_23504/m.61823 type:complete len:250 (+) Transcript_23504:324-1073(+)
MEFTAAVADNLFQHLGIASDVGLVALDDLFSLLGQQGSFRCTGRLIALKTRPMSVFLSKQVRSSKGKVPMNQRVLVLTLARQVQAALLWADGVLQLVLETPETENFNVQRILAETRDVFRADACGVQVQLLAYRREVCADGRTVTTGSARVDLLQLGVPLGAGGHIGQRSSQRQLAAVTSEVRHGLRHHPEVASGIRSPQLQDVLRSFRYGVRRPRLVSVAECLGKVLLLRVARHLGDDGLEPVLLLPR